MSAKIYRGPRFMITKDAQTFAGRLADVLSEKFGGERVKESTAASVLRAVKSMAREVCEGEPQGVKLDEATARLDDDGSTVHIQIPFDADWWRRVLKR